jgi:hypothetical protein
MQNLGVRIAGIERLGGQDPEPVAERLEPHTYLFENGPNTLATYLVTRQVKRQFGADRHRNEDRVDFDRRL